MLPKHGQIDCRVCFPEVSAETCKPSENWKMLNDPCAWGGNDSPEYLLLGFSKGFTQAGKMTAGKFEDIAFADMRDRLTKALVAMEVLSTCEHVNDNINDPNSKIAFGSLIRCSVSRVDEKATEKRGEKIFSCTGPLITKSFDEIPEVLDNCTKKYLTDLPSSIKVVFFLSNTDKYVQGVQSIVRRLFPQSFERINSMCVEADGKSWIHLAHPSGLNGHFNKWLETDTGPGLKRIKAMEGLTQGMGLSNSVTKKEVTETVHSTNEKDKNFGKDREISQVKKIYATGTRGDAAGKEFSAKPNKDGKYVLNKKRPSTSTTATNMAANKEYVDTLDEAYNLLKTEQYLINLVCAKGSRALRKYDAVKVLTA